MATIYEVSKLANVSLATVSRVMNGNTKVSDKTREKVLSAMRELGYRPNATARSLASNRTDTVGVLVSELNGAFFGEMMAGIEQELRLADKHVIITTGHSEEEKEKDGIEFLLSRNCDALILHVEGVSDEYMIELSKGKVPVYLVGRNIEQISENCISLDNEYGGYLATTSILAQGHKEIAYIAGQQFKPDAIERFAGHKKALSEAGVELNQSLFFEGDFKETGGAAGIKALLATGIPFTALVCANDEMASGAMKYAREHGIDLPKDLSIIGFDNVIFANYLYPKLTTVEYPIFEMGQMGAKLALREVYGKQDVYVKQVFSPQLKMRDSTLPV
ncbi:LacI family DNA-binding transcriptional regulator [Thalassotalea agarivorans]|uniref:Transcriptional regulator, LacI family n=1 Tax=Thalassotalea agarivorans TaxID=349064 RepID=A0A1I0E0B7_THASX|nr:LacI family DNA-binding transcriptional regulator [Thalassotalea agarivorans]SET38403.1 transcriptional regulator, LacI family [Thalassotalea agarivorans]